jgi:nitrile hydratase accessory protein
LSAPDPSWPIPADLADERAFAAPWQAQAFALAVALHAKGTFTWPEWTEALGAELARTPQDDASSYYAAWLSALERLSAERGLASPEALASRQRAWAHAYMRTPHGKPVVL